MNNKKKYNNTFICYGQSTTGRINYHQKMGVANGIIQRLKLEMRDRKMNLSDWRESISFKGATMTFVNVTIVIPANEENWLDGKCPIFEYESKIGLIDMLHFDDELSFHIMLYNSKTKSYKNGGWHTVRECLTLEQTCTLFEYVEDVIKEIIVLPPGESRHK